MPPKPHESHLKAPSKLLQRPFRRRKAASSVRLTPSVLSRCMPRQLLLALILALSLLVGPCAQRRRHVRLIDREVMLPLQPHANIRYCCYCLSIYICFTYIHILYRRDAKRHRSAAFSGSTHQVPQVAIVRALVLDGEDLRS